LPPAGTPGGAGAEAPAPSNDRQSDHFPCASCGAQLRFSPGQKRLGCAYCGHEQEIPHSAEARAQALRGHDLHAALARALPEAEIEETRVLSCPSCGGQVQFDPREHARQCAFCGTPVVAESSPHRHIKPAALLPFRLTEAEAHAAMERWIKGLWLAPNGLKHYARSNRKLDGIYIPYWCFDADTVSDYAGERGDAYYVTVPAGKGRTRRVRRVRWTPVSGQVSRDFRDLLVLATESLPRQQSRGLEPWPLDQLAPYDPQFLAGFRAAGYTVDLRTGHRIGHERMGDQIRRDVRARIGGDQQRITRLTTRHAHERFKHILLPIWMAAYRYRDRSFRFIVNGQTGAVQGERPWSPWKIAFAVLLGAGLAGVVVWLIGIDGLLILLDILASMDFDL